MARWRNLLPSGRAGTLAALAIVGLTMGPATAGAVTFGADLAAHAANSAANSTCAYAPPSLIYPINSPSCMWSYIGNGTDSLVPPSGGVATAVRVKVGATTGPMRVNVIRFLFRQTGDPAHPTSAGPFLEAYGPQFTPTANDTTTVPTNLSLKVDPTPLLTDTQTIQVIDALALEVLSPSVPVPVFADPGALTYPVYPGPTSQNLPAPSPNGLSSYGSMGWGVLMNADFTPDTPAAGGGGTGGGVTAPTLPAPQALPTIALPRKTAPVKSGRAAVDLLCQVVDCTGTVTLQRAAGGGAAARLGTAPKKAVKLGSKQFSIKAGQRSTIKVKLNSRALALLRSSRRIKAQAVVTFSSGGGATATYPLTVKR